MPLQLIIDIGLFLIYCAVFVLLLAWTWKFWMLYVNTTWVKSLKWTTIEIKLPREINKSPEAAEIFLRSLIEGGGLGSWLKENWEGRIPNYASLEIASLEGVIHFYIRLEKKLLPRVEAAIYSQYPNVEIIELEEDYMEQIPKVTRHKDSAATWATEWVLTKGGEAEVGNKDKSGKSDDTVDKLKYKGDMYPIKTYKDWGLDKDPKEMYKHDPLTYVLEEMGSMGKGEYFIYQILIRDAAVTKPGWTEIYEIEKNGDDKNKEKGKKLSDLVKLELDKYKTKWSLKKKGDLLGFDEYGMPKTEKKVKTPAVKDKDGKIIEEAVMEDVELKIKRDIAESKPIPMNEREDDAKKNIELIQRKMSKPQVFAIVRTVYVATTYSEIGSRIPMVMGFTKPFNEEGFNSFRPDPSSITDPFDFPWQNTFKKLVPWRKENMYGDLTGRDGFFSFNKGIDKEKNMIDIFFFNKSNLSKKIFTTFWKIIFYPFKPTIGLSGFTLNVEELATLYHFPGEVAATPSIPRIDSVKGSSPSNLPIEK